jgi:hypothetical protein
LGLSGGQVGTGRALFLATSTWLLVEAEEIWVEAKAPVRTRAATAERIRSFICGLPRKFIDLAKFFAGQIS